MPFRVGQGFDVHKFTAGDHVILGGVKIPFTHGLLAHSDGDVLLHAICDALLGAAALGDIGRHFPDTDAQFHKVDSRRLLRQVVGKLNAEGFLIGNIDSIIIAQAPKMAPYIEAMRGNIAEDCSISVSAVSVKATTTEKLGFTGRGEGIACQAGVLIEQPATESTTGRGKSP